MGRDMEAKKAYDREFYKRYRLTAKGKAAKLRSHLKEKYGITLAEYETLQEKSDGRCAICRREKKLYIDHCHATGKVRGLLCNGCNSKLGWYEKYRTDVKEHLHGRS